MRRIGAFEAKNKLAALLDAVEAGEEVAITRHGTPVARLVPIGAGPGREVARAAVGRLRALRRNVTLGDDLTLRDLINDGRA